MSGAPRALGPTSLADVAALAGVSTGTVSRALTRPEMISEATRSRVLASAERLGYVANGAARALAMRKTRTVGALVPRFGGSSFPTLVQALETALAAEGYTLLLSTSSTHSIGPNLNPRMPYDAVRDFTPIGQLGNAPSIMLVPNNSPAKTVKEWIDYAKKNPGRLNYASSGNGTIVQLSAELFKAQADVFVVHIPYKGTALAIPDLITGKVDVLFDSLPTGMPHVRDGRLRALGVTTLKPTALAPGIPAIADVLPGYESNTWFGLFGPKGLPPEVVSRVNTAANQVLQDPEVMDKLQRFGIEPVGGTPAQFTTMLASESAKWKKIIDCKPFCWRK